MADEFTVRPTAESAAERKFLERRLAEVERDLGRVAAAAGTPSPLTQPMQALERGRALVSDLLKEVHVRPLDAAAAAHLAWLDRMEARMAAPSGGPAIALERIALDRRVLEDLVKEWQSSRR